jgi:hypothetical protein
MYAGKSLCGEALLHKPMSGKSLQHVLKMAKLPARLPLRFPDDRMDPVKIVYKTEGKDEILFPLKSSSKKNLRMRDISRTAPRFQAALETGRA